MADVGKNLILRTQKNEVLAELQARGLSPGEFAWEEVRSKRSDMLMVSQVRHTPTGYYFMFDFQNDLHFCEYSPGEVSSEAKAYSGDWVNERNKAREWLDNVKRETSAPDLWAAIAQERQLVSDASRATDGNAPFIPAEQQRIRAGIEELRTYILTTQSLAADHAAFVTRRLNYLADASERLGRKDWINMAVGVITTIVLNAMFAPDTARELLRIAGSVFGWVSPGPLLP